MKIKLLFFMCLIGALSFSCSDDDNIIELIAEKLNVNEVKAGDELIITGTGFSPVNEENRVRLNDLTIPVTSSTVSELKLVIPKEATTGSITVTVDEKTVDFGVLTVYLELIAEKLNTTEVKAGDELIITGAGFSAINEENIVKLNDLTIPVTFSTVSEIKLVIPKEATTGNIMLTVDEKSIDFGALKVLKEQIFVLKSVYNTSEDFIVSLDPETGEETPFVKLPKLDHDNSELMYSSLCYLEDTKELLLMQRPEYPVDQYKILKFNIDSKELTEYDFGSIDDIEDIGLLTDEKNNVYIVKDLDWTEKDGNAVTIEKLNLESKTSGLIATSKGQLIYDLRVSAKQNRIYFVRESNTDGDNTLEYIDLNDNSLNELALNSIKNLNRILLDNEGALYAILTPSDEKHDLIKIDVDKKTEELVISLPDGEIWYGSSCFSESTNEFRFFLDNDYDVTTNIIKVNVIEKTINTIQYNNPETYLGYPVGIFM